MDISKAWGAVGAGIVIGLGWSFGPLVARAVWDALRALAL